MFVIILRNLNLNEHYQEEIASLAFNIKFDETMLITLLAINEEFVPLECVVREKMIEAMNNIVPGIANDETLLYGIEVKFYSNKVLIDKNCETNINGLYSIGDSSSWTRGLSLSSGMGLFVGENILKKFK